MSIQSIVPSKAPSRRIPAPALPQEPQKVPTCRAWDKNRGSGFEPEVKTSKQAATQHGTGCPDCAGTSFDAGPTAKPTAKPAAAAGTADPVGKWTDGTFREHLGRAPTAAERASFVTAFNEMVQEGKHPWAAGATLISFLRAGPEFKKAHPLGAWLDDVHFAETGQRASMEELKKAEAQIGARIDGGEHVWAAGKHYIDQLRTTPAHQAYKQAHPLAEAVHGLYRDVFGRAATPEDMAGAEKIIRTVVDGGKHLFEGFGAVSAFMRVAPEWSVKHPHGHAVNGLYQEVLGRPASNKEINDADGFIAGLGAQGKSPQEALMALKWILAHTDEFRARNPAPVGGPAGPAAPGAPLGGARQDTAYINGVPQNITVYPVGNGQYLRDDAARAYLAMAEEARRAGISLNPVSGFRTMAQQQELYRRYLNGTGNLAARPGYSNHQGAISMDIGNVGGYGTATYRWLQQNAARFGFVNDVGGEYWHWTYKR